MSSQPPAPAAQISTFAATTPAAHLTASAAGLCFNVCCIVKDENRCIFYSEEQSEGPENSHEIYLTRE